MIPVKYKNIIYAEEKYIMQQCNCLTITSHGLSKTLAESFLMEIHMRGDVQLGEETVLFKKIE